MSKINIAFACDSNYIAQLSTVIVSILLNSKKETSLSFKILHKDFSQNEIEKVKSLISFSKNKNVDFEFVNMQEFLKGKNLSSYLNSNKEYNYITDVTYYRFFIPELFLNLNKILYLDVDILVKKDLSELFNKDITGFLAGVVECEYIKRLKNKNKNFPQTNLSIQEYEKNILNKRTDKYFNAGVLLLNLDLIRKEKISQKLWNFLEENKNRIVYQDQDVLNSVFDNRVIFLDKKYNKHAVNSYKFNDVVLLHFIGKDKPWDIYMHNSKEYLKYYKKTPFFTTKENLEKKRINLNFKIFNWTIFNFSKYQKYFLICLFGIWVVRKKRIKASKCQK